MSKYVNIEELEKVVNEEFYLDFTKIILNNTINELSSADVVEVVRCKDCIWHGEKDNGDLFCEIKSENWGEPFAVKPEHYCSSGERKKTE